MDHANRLGCGTFYLLLLQMGDIKGLGPSRSVHSETTRLRESSETEDTVHF